MTDRAKRPDDLSEVVEIRTRAERLFLARHVAAKWDVSFEEFINQLLDGAIDGEISEEYQRVLLRAARPPEDNIIQFPSPSWAVTGLVREHLEYLSEPKAISLEAWFSMHLNILRSTEWSALFPHALLLLAALIAFVGEALALHLLIG